MVYIKEQCIWISLRLGLGWILLWSFIDKVFGLGFSTKPEGAWLAGGSPTTGFLQFAARGPLAALYQGLAGSVFIDWLFMLALLLIGLALISGIVMRIAGYAGALLMLLMWLALLPPEHNPIIDEHIIYAIVFLGLSVVRPGKWLGLGEWWANTGLVKKYKVLE